jgi:2-amino-4-hydroxy-6-hydroxymethyldihydropteridine diphosphokinase
VGGPTGQAPFINAVAAIHTTATPWEVWHCIRNVEKEFGRERNLRWEARRIDLDILLHDEARIWTPHLKIPHPRMCMRRFILLPAADVARDWLDPVSGWTIGQLAENVRHGPSNFVLLGEASSKPESLLAEVARRSGAQWRSSTQKNIPPERWDNFRWVSVRTTLPGQLAASNFDAIRSELPGTKLLIALAPPVPAAEIAWEDYHRTLASNLGLRAEAAELGAAPMGIGPRYLLVNDDPDWSVQELIAALEAMDCPIEPL